MSDISQQKSRNINLDFLRGIAILGVVGLHVETPTTHYKLLEVLFSPFKEIGGRGVDLFFLLSGFLVGGLLLKEYREGKLVSGGRFLIRRMLKIWPAYYAYILFNLLIPHHRPDTFLFQNVFHLQNYLGSSLSQTWSLAIEEHFYLGLALLMIAASYWRWSPARLIQIFSALCLLSLLLRLEEALHGRFDAALKQTQNRMDSLLFGVIFAVLFWTLPATYEALTRRRWPLAVIAAAGIWSIWFWFPLHPVLMWSFSFTASSLGLLAFFALVFRHATPISRFFLYRGIAWVGLYSYGIYLWHSVMRQPAELVMRRLRIHSDPLAWIVQVGLEFALAIGIGYLMTRLIEIPVLLIRDRLFPAASPTLSPAPVSNVISPTEAVPVTSFSRYEPLTEPQPRGSGY